MKRIKSFLKNFVSDESGQGTAEYVLLLVVAVALVMVFKNKIRGVFETKTDEVANKIQDFNADQ